MVTMMRGPKRSFSLPTPIASTPCTIMFRENAADVTARVHPNSACREAKNTLKLNTAPEEAAMIRNAASTTT